MSSSFPYFIITIAKGGELAADSCHVFEEHYTIDPSASCALGHSLCHVTGEHFWLELRRLMFAFFAQSDSLLKVNILV